MPSIIQTKAANEKEDFSLSQKDLIQNDINCDNVNLISLFLKDMSIIIGKRQLSSITLSDGSSLIPGLDLIEDAESLEKLANEFQKSVFDLNLVKDTIIRIIEEAKLQIDENRLSFGQNYREIGSSNYRQEIDRLNRIEWAIDDIHDNMLRINDINRNFETGFKPLNIIRFQVISALNDISVLIGEKGQSEVTLNCGKKIVPGLGDTFRANQIKEMAREINEKHFNVLVLGIFKNGKSTFINAMLGENALVTGDLPSTPIITELVYGSGDDVQVFENGKTDPIILSRIEFKKKYNLTPDEILPKVNGKDLFQKTAYARVQYPYKLLQDGVHIVDSPGLKDKRIHTDVVEDFIKKTQAIVFLFDATHFVFDDELEFIRKNFESNRLERVFFICNKMGLIKNPELFKKNAAAKLSQFFLEKDGKFDQELFSRRLFFVDAEYAFTARSKRPVDQELLGRSGIVEFERELEIFLSGDARMRAVFQSTAENVIECVSDANHKILNQKESLAVPLDEIELRYKETKERLQRLGIEENKIQITILNAGKDIADFVIRDFDYYVKKLKDNWQIDSKEIINLDDVIGESDKDKIKSIMVRERNKYLKIKVEEWLDQLSALTKKDIARLQRDLSNQIEYIQLELSQIESIFSFGAGKDGKALESEQERIGKMVSTTLDSVMNDFGKISAPESGNNLTGVIGAAISCAVVAFTFGGPIAAIIGFIIGTIFSISSEDIKSKILPQLRENIFDDILSASSLEKIKGNIRSAIEDQFNLLARYVEESLTRQIDDANSNMNRIIKERRDASYSINNEKERLQSISYLIMDRFNLIYSSAYGKTLTLEAIHEEARRKKGAERDKTDEKNQKNRPIQNSEEPKNKDGFEHDVFLCFSSEDRPIIEDIIYEFKREGVKYWVEFENKCFGKIFEEDIKENLQKSRYIIPCLSKNLKNANWAVKEYNIALIDESKKKSNIRVIPLKIDDCGMDDIPAYLMDRIYVDYSNKEDFHKLIDVVKKRG